VGLGDYLMGLVVQGRDHDITSGVTTLNATTQFLPVQGKPHGFPWFMQEQAYNFCHIFAGGELPSKPDE